MNKTEIHRNQVYRLQVQRRRARGGARKLGLFVRRLFGKAS